MVIENMHESSNMLLKDKSSLRITVIGAGIAGTSTALHLANLGHKISLVDSQVHLEHKRLVNLNASQASLGILMGYVYRRSKGRSWELRKRSMELWPNLINQLNINHESIQIHRPLVQLASSEKEFQSMQKLVHKKNQYEIEFLNKESLLNFSRKS